MSKFNRTRKPSGVIPGSSKIKNDPAMGQINSWQRMYGKHIEQNTDIRKSESTILTSRIAEITTTVVKYKLQGELRGMLFNSKKVNSGWGYSVAILLANIVFISIATMVFVQIEGTAEVEELKQDWETKQHLIAHVQNASTKLPQKKIDAFVERLLQLQKEMCRKSNSRAGEKSWEYTGSLHYCLTILSTIGYGVAAPHSNLSKALSVTYAMCGIPIYAVYLSYAYLVISFTLDRAAIVLFKCVGWKRPNSMTRTIVKLILANIILWTYMLVLVFMWTPIEEEEENSDYEQKTALDEIYWQVIRFTSIGFGDEFRDVGKDPKHIPSVINVLTCGFVLLPFGISVTSFFFQMYRKLFGNRRKWIGTEYRKIRAKALANERLQKVIKNGKLQGVRLKLLTNKTNGLDITKTSNSIKRDMEPNTLTSIDEHIKHDDDIINHVS